jgi:hypothetical protein
MVLGVGARAVEQSPHCVTEVREGRADNYRLADWNRAQSSNDERKCEQAARDQSAQRLRTSAVLEILDDTGVRAKRRK